MENKMGQLIKSLCMILIFSFSFQAFALEISISNIDNVSSNLEDNMYSDILFNTIKGVIESKGYSVSKTGEFYSQKRADFFLKCYYYTDADKIFLTSKIYNKQNELINISKSELNKRSGIFDEVKNHIKDLFSSLTDIKNDKPVSAKLKSEVSNLVRDYRTQYFLYTRFTQSYFGTGFLSESKRDYGIDIASPYNRWLNTTVSSIDFDILKLKTGYFEGFSLNIYPPMIIEGKNLSSFSKIALGYVRSIDKNIFLKVSFDYLFFMFTKYSQDEDFKINVSLITAGIGFDFRCNFPQINYELDFGFSVYPPIIPYTSGSNNSGPSSPFCISLNGSIGSFLFPVSPRVGMVFYVNSDFGVFIGYSLVAMALTYNTNLEVEDNYSKKYEYIYLGRETGLMNEIKIGLVYKNIIK